MGNENMDSRIRDIIVRLRKIWSLNAINVAVNYWQHEPLLKIEPQCDFWIDEIDAVFKFRTLEEMEKWLDRKELLFKKF